jgi:tetraacyldisaccharide 4'-kinase
MDSARAFLLETLSGQRTGAIADVARAGLSCAGLCYRTAVALRNRRFDYSTSAVISVPLPVVSIGNLTTGGTGKTPLVAWVVAQLRALGGCPAILSRGYRSLDGTENDEKRLLDRLCPEVPHVQNPDRAAAARRLIRESAVDTVVLDDGFQHRRLHRDLNIVLIDVLNPWGFGRLLPRGLLREPRSALRRADLVILTRADLCTHRELIRVHREVSRHTEAAVSHAAFRPSALVNARGERAPLSLLAHRRTAAFCGVGNPDGFQRTVSGLIGENPATKMLAFPDHHHYGAADIERIVAHADSQNAELLLTTEKDLVKFADVELANRPLWGLRIDVEFTYNGAAVRQAVADIYQSFHRPSGEVSVQARAA